MVILGHLCTFKQKQNKQVIVPYSYARQRKAEAGLIGTFHIPMFNILLYHK